MYVSKYKKKRNKFVCQGVVLDIYRTLEHIDDSKADWTEEKVEKFVDITKELKDVRNIYDNNELIYSNEKDLSIQNKFDHDIFLNINDFIDHDDYDGLNAIISILKDVDIDADNDDFAFKMSLIKFTSNRYMLMNLRADLAKSLADLEEDLKSDSPLTGQIVDFIEQIDVRLEGVNSAIEDLKSGKMVKRSEEDLNDIVKDINLKDKKD